MDPYTASADAAWQHPQDEAASPVRSRTGTVARVVLALLVAAAAGAGVSLATRHVLDTRATDAGRAGATGLSDGPLAGVEPIPRPTWQASLQPARDIAPARQPAGIAATLLVGGVEHDPSTGPIALPDGTRFQVRLRPERDSVLEIVPVNPMGEVSPAPLWMSRVSARVTATTPLLRLEGMRGYETLVVVQRDLQGRVISEKAVRILHL